MLSKLIHPINAKSRSISPENLTGEKNKGALAKIGEGNASQAAADLGVGWKVNPYIIINPRSTAVLCDIKGSGTIKHIWLTPAGTSWRFLILRIYWDGSDTPSVECPLGDFFANPLNKFAQISSLAVCVNPGSAFNCYWEMPFKTECRIELENLANVDARIYYQIDYFEEEHPEEILYFHAQFRRVNPLPYKEVYTIVDGIKGRGHYVGTYMLWSVKNNGWWGEGEIKFYIDGDENPTICGTGTEDYFCGSYNFEHPDTHQYAEFTTPYSGLPLVVRPDGLYNSQQKFSLYRWHITDPIIFEEDLKVTIQALGWRDGGRYLPLQDDISSVAYWYQTLPAAPFPPFPSKDELEII